MGWAGRGGESLGEWCKRKVRGGGIVPLPPLLLLPMVHSTSKEGEKSIPIAKTSNAVQAEDDNSGFVEILWHILPNFFSISQP
ncbi:hypothetical protein niasHT_020507 [Heterodera trifolii]|uniref:Uncharacterized protein n=1 Tax=Heterodera trifolii TaxID=157864 RepID=A0ABD2J9G8_9BILA